MEHFHLPCFHIVVWVISMNDRPAAKRKKQIYRFLLPVALFYSIYLSFTGIHTAITQQMQSNLLLQITAAQQQALEGEEELDPVYLKRDQNNQIIAIAVNGIVLNQIQGVYYQFLQQGNAEYTVCLTAADLLGSKLLFWIPGSIPVALRPNIHWEAEIRSRTFVQDDTTRHFQVVLVTTGTATVSPWQELSVHEERVLYEALLYS